MTVNGISVVLCCYNSVTRLRATLAALANQNIPLWLEWELLLVDNASTDGTAKVAVRLWREFGAVAPLSILLESEPGLNYARKTGMSSANYDIVVWCDDDNHLQNDYLKQVANAFKKAESTVAAIGGRGIPMFEKNPPDWFNSFQEAYATGAQQTNKSKHSLYHLYGAGLAVKRYAWQHLYEAGFKPLLQGRTKKNLSSAEDTEFAYALQLAGYSLAYEDRMVFYHMLPQTRLTRQYLTKLFKSFGEDGPIRNIYEGLIRGGNRKRFIESWLSHFTLCLIRIVKYAWSPPKAGERRIYFLWNVHYARQLIRMRRGYGGLIRGIEDWAISVADRSNVAVNQHAHINKYPA